MSKERYYEKKLENKKVINISVIENYLKDTNLSKNKFCKNYKFSISTLNNILKNNLNINIKAIFKLAKIINIKVSELFRKD